MNKVYFLLAVAGMSLLYFISFLSQPSHVELREIWKHDGEKVIVEGIVKNRKGNLIEISDGNATGKIYFEKDGVEYGDFIRVYGDVGKYGDDFAVYADKVEIVKKWNNETISLPYLAENYENYVGMNVNVTGYIYSKYRGYFYITDEYIEYKARVYCEDEIPFEEYEKVYVNALFLYNPESMNFYLKILDDSHGVFKARS